jgi:hypothetical protein
MVSEIESRPILAWGSGLKWGLNAGGFEWIWESDGNVLMMIIMI